MKERENNTKRDRNGREKYRKRDRLLEREIWVGEERKIERQGGREKDRNRDKLGEKEGERGSLEVKERKIERERVKH